MQIFRPGVNTVAKISILAGALVTVLVLNFLFVQDRSPYSRARAGIAVAQPVRFSHQLHSDQLNISCNYCHASANEYAYAGIPDTHTCMSCHSQIAVYSELLEPVRTSYETGDPLVWNKVHDLAEHVYFNHGVHVQNGVGCETCHGRVDQMALVWQAETMTMAWCLECHFAPEDFIRPADEIFTFGYEPPIDQAVLGEQLLEEYEINPEGLGDCWVCHR
ncbi:MAG: cytochrome c3 family protein [Chloroflexi bacterium]|nr:cytochrome c3 family protein [Chloroflexota bacterium]